MEKVFTLLFLLTITNSFGQLVNNRHDRLTEEQFQELLSHRDQFIPKDLGKDTVVIVRYTPDRLEQFQVKARNISLASHGVDTTALKNETLLAEGQIKMNRKTLDKYARQYPDKLKKELKKKKIESIIIDENDLANNYAVQKRYWLKTTFISTQESPEQTGGWVMTMTNFFYDKTTGKNYEVFLPLNHTLLELVK